jgi:hypothetical protein
VAVATPPLLPPLVFFARWHRSDALIAGDTFAYSRRSTHNRARIQTPEGLLWLTVPVESGQTGAPMRSVRLARHATDARLPWPRKLARTLRFVYGTAPFYAHYAPQLEAAFGEPHPSLADLNVSLLRLVARWLCIDAPLVLASSLDGAPPTEAGALAAVGGALVPDAFAEPPRYAHNGAFTPGLSVLDALMAVGPEAAATLRADEHRLGPAR